MRDKFQELTDSQWQVMAIFLPIKRKREINLRSVVNGIFWILNTGAQWRNLESKYPAWQAVYYYFSRWKSNGTWEKINICLNEIERASWGKDSDPTLMCIDSQSVKAAQFVSQDKGIDGNKKVNGRKRQVAVDTLGLVWGVYVHAANISDSVAGCELLKRVRGSVTKVKKILVDGGYKEQFFKKADELGIEAEVSSRPETAKGFVPLKWRWVSERTFAWFNSYRRLDKEREKTVQSSETMILLANSYTILSRMENWKY
jgi:putative transposase